jgi:hypothetical protein
MSRLPDIPDPAAQLQARLAANTSEVARLAATATHPRTRASLVVAKMALQEIARDGRGTDAEELALFTERLQNIEATLQAISRTIEAFGPEAMPPVGGAAQGRAGSNS